MFSHLVAFDKVMKENLQKVKENTALFRECLSAAEKSFKMDPFNVVCQLMSD